MARWTCFRKVSDVMRLLLSNLGVLLPGIHTWISAKVVWALHFTFKSCALKNARAGPCGELSEIRATRTHIVRCVLPSQTNETTLKQYGITTIFADNPLSFRFSVYTADFSESSENRQSSLTAGLYTNQVLSQCANFLCSAHDSSRPVFGLLSETETSVFKFITYWAWSTFCSNHRPKFTVFLTLILV